MTPAKGKRKLSQERGEIYSICLFSLPITSFLALPRLPPCFPNTRLNPSPLFITFILSLMAPILLIFLFISSFQSRLSEVMFFNQLYYYPRPPTHSFRGVGLKNKATIPRCQLPGSKGNISPPPPDPERQIVAKERAFLRGNCSPWMDAVPQSQDHGGGFLLAASKPKGIDH